uniref:Uncharacterized protein n=1 Tax=Trichinella nativa TaxID=6335 RepID=A0A0V1IV22_9BILA
MIQAIYSKPVANKTPSQSNSTTKGGQGDTN